jgi:hypothetical protein
MGWHTLCSTCCMISVVRGRSFSVLVDLIAVVQRSDQEKELEMLLLRQ